MISEMRRMWSEGTWNFVFVNTFTSDRFPSIAIHRAIAFFGREKSSSAAAAAKTNDFLCVCEMKSNFRARISFLCVEAEK